jgi:Flp pilus assembly protein TadG
MFGPMISRWLRNRRGNVSIIFAFSIIPMVFLTGMGYDYASAALREEQLNAAADAAVLAALTPGLLTQDDTAATNAAMSTFMAQASVVDGVVIKQSDVTVTVTDTATTRTVQINYNAESQNFFPKVLNNTNYIALAGKSQANAQYAPNINFYLLLDSSPSMAIAATQNGIDTMVNNTSPQGGCAFGCHETHPSSESNNPKDPNDPTGKTLIDNRQLARNLGVTLRIDLLRLATQNLMTTAATAAQNDNATYQMAIYTFDVLFHTVQPMTANLTTAGTAASAIDTLATYDQGHLTNGFSNNDMDTDFDNAMSSINTVMPTPGNGTSQAGDTPQEILFVVTDGVEDESVNGTPTWNAALNSNINTGGARTMLAMNTGKTDWCTAIKNRGIRIAVLYTVYLPLPTNSFYNSNIKPFQPNIGTTLNSCASPGLYFMVDTGGDISAALTSLFETAIQTAHLSL